MAEEEISRRDFSRKMLGAVLTFSLFETLFSACSGEKSLIVSGKNDFVEPSVAPILKHWSVELNEFCGDLQISKISPLDWQKQIDRLYSRIELEELLKFIDFEKLTRKFEYPDLGVNTRNVSFPAIEGLPEKTFYVKKIFGMKKGRAVIPHGHSNMTSAHLVIKGEFALKHFEKVRFEDEHLIVKPTIDKLIGPGDFSSISDEKDNVHWFIADTEAAFTFDVIMLDLKGQKTDIHNLDIDAAERISDDLLRARILDVETALKKYGKQHH
ncbi:MAG: hypothetical protein R2747_07910 [Pyrinomonadaceae bacterium]